MAVVPLCYKIPSKDKVLPITKSVRNSEQEFICGHITLTERSRHSCSDVNDTYRRWHALYPAADTFKKAKIKMLMKPFGGATCSRGSFLIQNVAEAPVLWTMCNLTSYVKSCSKRTSRKENFCMVCYASEPSTSKEQLRLLESYFAKHQDDANQISSDSSNKMTEILGRSNDENNAKTGLDSLDAYLGKLKKDANIRNYVSSASDDQKTESNLVVTPFSVSVTSKRSYKGKLKDHRKLRQKDIGNEDLQQNNETPDLYLISTLASINIAVFLFEIASPIRNSEFELFSLPLLYGAKINDLILIGEWWRLVTPMFLHAGLLHVALGCWALLTFGPQVCKGYGSFTFFLIYTLGGISGNFTSFLQTPEPTVGGTGPVFAIIGAWLIYQIQNKDVVTRDPLESVMFLKAILATALGFIMSNYGPVDNWTHLGASFTGIIYGFLTCPILQVDDTSSTRSREERITLVRQSADPCKSLFLFTIFIVGLSSLLFFFEPL